MYFLVWRAMIKDSLESNRSVPNLADQLFKSHSVDHLSVFIQETMHDEGFRHGRLFLWCCVEERSSSKLSSCSCSTSPLQFLSSPYSSSYIYEILSEYQNGVERIPRFTPHEKSATLSVFSSTKHLPIVSFVSRHVPQCIEMEFTKNQKVKGNTDLRGVVCDLWSCVGDSLRLPLQAILFLLDLFLVLVDCMGGE